MIFFEDKDSFSFYFTSFKSETELTKGLWLLLVGVHESPPHIALISGGKYYSLSNRKVDCGTPLERFMNVLERKQVPALFIRLEIGEQPQIPKWGLNSAIQSPFRGLDLNIEKKINSQLRNIYKNLQPLGNTKQTCLSPIKEFFSEHISTDFASVNYVFELLALAEKKGLIKESVPIFCESTNSNRVTLPKYTRIQIRNKINELSSKQPKLITK